MIGFVLARFSYIKVSKDNMAPGQWYWYHRDFYQSQFAVIYFQLKDIIYLTGCLPVGLTLHLAAILPAGFLCVFQFIPKIRHTYLMAHCINDYIIYLLLIVGVLEAAMLTRRTLGGSFGAQICNSCLSIMTHFRQARLLQYQTSAGGSTQKMDAPGHLLHVQHHNRQNSQHCLVRHPLQILEVRGILHGLGLPRAEVHP